MFILKIIALLIVTAALLTVILNYIYAAFNKKHIKSERIAAVISLMIITSFAILTLG